MHRGEKYLASLFLSAALAAPLAANALAVPQDDRDHDKHEQNERDHKVYDPDHRDYHDWNQTEEQTYRGWLDERHEKYRDYGQLRPEDQRDYWQWRHNHEDNRQRHDDDRH